MLAAALVAFSISCSVLGQTPVACAPVPVGQPGCKVGWDVTIDPNIQQFLLIPDVGASITVGLPAKTTNPTTGMDTYSVSLPLTIVPVGNIPHTLRVEACQGTTVAAATNCSPASPPSPPFTSGLATVAISPRLSVGP